MLYKPCPHCGANLDPSELCDCMKKEAAPQQREQPPSKTTTPSLTSLAKSVKEGGGSDE